MNMQERIAARTTAEADLDAAYARQVAAYAAADAEYDAAYAVWKAADSRITEAFYAENFPQKA